MTEIVLSPRGRERLIERKLGKRGYGSRMIHTGKDYLVFATEKGRSITDNESLVVSGAGDVEHQICTFDADDNVYIILNSKKLRDSITQLEQMLSPMEAMRAAQEYEQNSQRAALKEKARWLLERFAGVVKQIGYGDTGD